MIAIPIREGGQEIDTLYIVESTSFPELRPDWLSLPTLIPARAINLYRHWLWSAIQRRDYVVCTALAELLNLYQHGRLEFDNDPLLVVLARCLGWLADSDIL
jgi:hypothetical protein